MDEKEAGFAARGGWWVVAQVPVLLGALLAPLAWGAASFDPRNAVQLAGAALRALVFFQRLACIEHTAHAQFRVTGVLQGGIS